LQLICEPAGCRVIEFSEELLLKKFEASEHITGAGCEKTELDKTVAIK